MPFSRFWDITMTLSDDIFVWPGDTPFSRTVRQSRRGDQTWSNSEIQMGLHTGTHMDAPRHVFEKGGDVNSIPLATLVGACRVVEVNTEIIDESQIIHILPQPGERILFKTANSELFSDGQWHDSYIRFDEKGAQALVESQVILVGIDGPSVDPHKAESHPAHTAFCEAGIAVVENLVFREVEPGDYTLICLPMKIDGSDGAPVHAILGR